MRVMHFSEVIADLEAIKKTTTDSNVVVMIDLLILKIKKGG